MQGHPKPSLSAARTGTDWPCGFAVEGPPFSGLVGRTRAFRIASLTARRKFPVASSCVASAGVVEGTTLPVVSRHPRGRGGGRGKRCSGGHQIEQVGIGDPGGLAGKPGASDQPQKTEDVAVCPRLPLQPVVFPRGGGKAQGGRPEKSAASRGTLPCAVSSAASRSIPH
jgi:hypothetical protein